MKNHCPEKPVSRFLPEDILSIGNRKMPLNKAILEDRDRTTNIDRGYIIDPDKIEIN